MGKRSRTQTLQVLMNGLRVGRWTSTSTHAYEFAYDPSWLEMRESRPVSLSMPLRAAPYKDEYVRPFFDNLLPDSEQIRLRIQNIAFSCGVDVMRHAILCRLFQ